ncbi:endophilin-B1 isoform X2 [Coccinella septempunctata]|uniref:endophilin-B1 isoform X2 n=1 Tax=Coccinella septempunctata TaxID=41139 RepID=UPI001D0628F6|nr:endophilin-B1 isoform X2 [Coccinella septempunctata]
MDFNVKKMVKDAGAALSRVVQLTEEKLGTSEKTELDAHFEYLWDRAENTKNCTEKIVRNTEAVLIPNPGNRIEDFIYEKIEGKRPSRLSNLEYLGLDMVEAGNIYGPGTAYGGTLIKVGQHEQKLGQVERDFIGSAALCFTQPLRKFLDTEVKTILKEKSLLETKRLDLDACKNRVRKARSMLGHQSAERDLRIAQSEFDRQAEITKLLLEGISSSHASHLRSLHEFVETQARFYSQCATVMTDLQNELSNLNTKPGASSDNSPVLNGSSGNPKENFQMAKVLYNYEPKDSSELKLYANEVIKVTEISGKTDDDYMLGEKGQQKGKVPRAYVEIIS